MSGPATVEPTPQTAWIPPNSTPTRLILVRHGVTEHSVAKIFSGRSDPELTEHGRKQAGRAADRVARLGPVHAVVSSPLRRTRQTAQIIADPLGLPIEVADGMIEADFGDWDGFNYLQVSQRWPDELRAWLDDPAVAPPNGESFDALTLRVRQARDEILAEHSGSTVVVVSHVSPIKTLVRLALDAPPSSLYRMFLAPASVSVIDWFAEGPVMLRSFNESAHL